MRQERIEISKERSPGIWVAVQDYKCGVQVQDSGVESRCGIKMQDLIQSSYVWQPESDLECPEAK